MAWRNIILRLLPSTANIIGSDLFGVDARCTYPFYKDYSYPIEAPYFDPFVSESYFYTGMDARRSYPFHIYNRPSAIDAHYSNPSSPFDTRCYYPVQAFSIDYPLPFVAVDALSIDADCYYPYPCAAVDALFSVDTRSTNGFSIGGSGIGGQLIRPSIPSSGQLIGLPRVFPNQSWSCSSLSGLPSSRMYPNPRWSSCSRFGLPPCHISSPIHTFKRYFAKRWNDDASDGSFMCFECYATFDKPGKLTKHYESEYPTLVKRGFPCHCGAFFEDDGDKLRHGCVMKSEETFHQFQNRMKRDRTRFGEKRYRCPAAGCQEFSKSPLIHHLHHNRRHVM